MTSLQIICDLDALMIVTEPEDVMYIFSAYSRADLEGWVFSFNACRDMSDRTKIVLQEVNKLIIIS